jgi:elongator complex protein 3
MGAVTAGKSSIKSYYIDEHALMIKTISEIVQ